MLTFLREQNDIRRFKEYYQNRKLIVQNSYPLINNQAPKSLP